MDQSTLRIVIAIAGVLLLAAIYFFGRPRKPGQGKRTAPAPRRSDGGRVEPTLRDLIESEDAEAEGAADTGVEPDALQAELELLERTLAGEDAAASASGPHAELGKRPEQDFDQIITLFVAARPGHELQGPDLVVAAEKAGLVYGHMNIFHRLVDGHPEQGPIFSVASMIQPGDFDMTQIQSLRTPGISFFMTLPGPLPALDAWETLLPTAQRMAELLDAVVLDEERNALGRQRVAHIRDGLRAYDRRQDKQNIRPNW